METFASLRARVLTYPFPRLVLSESDMSPVFFPPLVAGNKVALRDGDSVGDGP